ncbi:LLM class flavin-dependent oxidoreductase [Kitasatospora sp. NPDC091276]|uniref:LLM class flavin-dependent oxidoreductase n=1 Tax=Kitasatospora sp. NPDC091276 TaxID=3155300 RepID=UPI0034200CFF
MGLQFGFCFGTSLRHDVTRGHLWKLLDAVEQHGFDSFWFYNNNGDDMPPPLELAREVAHRTSALVFGPHVLVAAGLEPSAVVRELTDLYRRSNGRFVAQLGIGGPREALIRDPAEAAAALEDILRRLRRLVGESAGESSGSGPTGVPPVWLGGGRERTVRRVAALADGWVPAFITPAEYRRRLKVLDEERQHLGRTEHITRAVQLVYVPPAIDTPELRRELDAEVSAHKQGCTSRDVYAVGGDRALRERLAEFAAVGVEHVILVPARAVPDWEDEIARLHHTVTTSLG